MAAASGAAGGDRGDRSERWDLFCRVVDHFGDVGIAWRVARQLAAEGRRSVRLFVDGAETLARIEPRFEPHAPVQSIDDVTLLQWPADDDGSLAAADVVVEMLGCGLPRGYRDAMAAASASPDGMPVWVDYEHLTAEAWADGFHGLPSPHPTLPLIKHFFYPGFGPRTGGLPIEPDLDARRAAFVDDRSALDALWRRTGVHDTAGPAGGEALDERPERRISMFAYANAPLAALLDALGRDARHRWLVLAPEGPLPASIASITVPHEKPDGGRRFHSSADPRGGPTVKPGQQAHATATPASASPRPIASPRLRTIPFTDQADYDRLLWACDVNFVRGEDSFVRAQAAGRPLVWQAYVQSDAAHLTKLSAFERRYAADVPEAAAAAQRALWTAWNLADASAVAAAVPAWLEALPVLAATADAWRAGIVADPPLVERLAAFVAGVAAARRPAAGAAGLVS